MQTLRPSVASQPYASSPGRNSWEEPCVFGGVQPCVSTSGTLCASCTPTWHQGTFEIKIWELSAIESGDIFPKGTSWISSIKSANAK